MRDSEAYDLYADALELIQNVAQKQPLAAYCLDGLGEIDLEHGRLDQSEAHFRESRTIRQAALGESHREVAYSLDGLARVAAARGKLEEAEALLREATAILGARIGIRAPRPDRGCKSLTATGPTTGCGPRRRPSPPPVPGDSHLPHRGLAGPVCRQRLAHRRSEYPPA